MHRYVVPSLCVLLGLLMSPGCDPVHDASSASNSRVPAEAPGFRVLSWNLFFVPRPSKFLHKPTCRAEAMAPLLEPHELLALQETFDRKTTNLLARRLLKSHPHQLLSLPSGGSFKLNGGVSLLSAYPIVRSQIITYNACHGRLSDCRAARGAILATIAAPHSQIDVVVTHLDAGEAPGDHVARIAQLQQLHEAMREYGMMSSARPTLLLGDLNVNGISDVRRDERGGLTPWGSVMEALDEPEDLFWSAHAPWRMTPDQTERPNTYLCTSWSLKRCDDTSEASRWTRRARLDYAMWWPTSDRKEAMVKHLSYSGERCGLHYLSDHRAVQVTLRAP